MNTEIADLARLAAQDLIDVEPSLPPKLEAEIQRYEREKHPEQFELGTSIALASLLLSVAQFAYGIVRDRKSDAKLSPDALRRHVRLELDEKGVPDTHQRAAVIEAVIRAVNAAQC